MSLLATVRSLSSRTAFGVAHRLPLVERRHEMVRNARMTVIRHAGNRVLRIILESEDYHSLSDIQLDPVA